VTDGKWRTLAALEVATSQRRWRLLAYAVEEGPFLATQAAAIAKLSRDSGNARSTHAERLCKARLLKREPGRPVRYRATARGAELYRAVRAILEKEAPGESAPTPKMQIRAGEEFDLLAALAPSGRGRTVVVTIRRKT
jgi:hypothetical protein